MNEFEYENNGVKLTPTEFALTREKLDKINARAAKRGFTGLLELTYERVVVKRTLFIGMEVEEVFYRTQIVGDAPCYNGWRFLARIDRLEGDLFTLAKAPSRDKTPIDRSLVKLGICEHCSSNRVRKHLYLVQNVESGEIKNVGSTCIKDFLGWNASFSFISEEEATDSLFGSSGYQEPTYTPATIIATAFVAIKHFGWVPASHTDKVTTKSHVFGLLYPSLDKHSKELYDPLRQYVPEALTKIAPILEWINSLDGDSDFTANIKAAASAPEVTGKQIGILAFAPEGYARSLAQAAEVAQQKEAPSEFIGQVGDKLTISGTITSVRYINGQFGTTVLYTIQTERGLVKWFSSHCALGDDVDVNVTLKGTVKKLDEFRGVKSTVLTRCKEVAQ